jgi:ADP-heptose:LPS heptosyltransferase
MDDLKKQRIVEQLNHYALDCKKEHNFFTAKIALERALAMRPETGMLWNNYGAVLWSMDELEEAEQAIRKGHELGYETAVSQCNLGLIMGSKQKWDEAASCFQRACLIGAGDKDGPKDQKDYRADKDPMEALWEKSLLLLDKGDWLNGFKEYEVRRHIKNSKLSKLNYPMWEGEDLNGKTIFIQSEQGYGDRILFSRYLHWIKKTWPDCHIKWLCDPKLHGLFWYLKEECDIEFIPDKVPWPKADYAQFLMTLPKIHKTTPDNVYPDPGLIRKRALQAKDACNLPEPETAKTLKVGICWTGNPEMEQNVSRSIPFELMLGLARNPNVLLYSLQIGEGAKDMTRLSADSLVCNIAPELEKEGFAGTAAAISNLDLVITCCTSVAHLAGSVGVPTWVLLCYSPYWVWLRGRDDSVWYPNVRLFRQDAPGNWQKVINNVERELEILIDKTDEMHGISLFSTDK